MTSGKGRGTGNRTDNMGEGRGSWDLGWGRGGGIRPGVVSQQKQSTHGNTIIKPSVSLVNLKKNSLA